MFELTEEQLLVQDTARRFAEEDIAPTLEEEEKKHEFRADRVGRMGELGFFACALPDELGGNGMGFLDKGTVNFSFDHLMIDYSEFRDISTGAAFGAEPLYHLDANIMQLFLSFWY